MSESLSLAELLASLPPDECAATIAELSDDQLAVETRYCETRATPIFGPPEGDHHREMACRLRELARQYGRLMKVVGLTAYSREMSGACGVSGEIIEMAVGFRNH
jgi:hypothetical protein